MVTTLQMRHYMASKEITFHLICKTTLVEEAQDMIVKCITTTNKLAMKVPISLTTALFTAKDQKSFCQLTADLDQTIV